MLAYAGVGLRADDGRMLTYADVCWRMQVSAFGPMMPKGSAAVSLTYLASERVVPGVCHYSTYADVCF
jgi:hypothetical protein